MSSKHLENLEESQQLVIFLDETFTADKSLEFFSANCTLEERSKHVTDVLVKSLEIFAKEVGSTQPFTFKIAYSRFAAFNLLIWFESSSD